VLTYIDQKAQAHSDRLGKKENVCQLLVSLSTV